jgi:transaldolase
MTTPPTDQSISVEQRTCIAACASCRDACQEALAYALDTRGDQESASHVRLLRECADRCDEAAQALGEGSVSDARLEAAREASVRLARELIEHFADDATLKACADATSRVAERCLSAQTQGVAWDKVVADTFPGSDPPPH